MKKKIVFLDRDGVICQKPDNDAYVLNWDEFHFLPGSIEAIVRLTKAGWPIMVISNQACISRGLNTQGDLDDMTAKAIVEIEKAGGRIEKFYYCPHQNSDKCDCRKPKTGMFREAARDFEIDFAESYFIGDSRRDIEAAHNIGCHSILVLSGGSRREDTDGWEIKPEFICKDLLEAASVYF